MDTLWGSLCMNALKKKVAEAGGAERDLDERDRERCPSHHLLQHSAYFQPVLSINFLLPVFEKLYKYAEQPNDKIPISGIAR